MYFGRFGAPQPQSGLDANTTYAPTFSEGHNTGQHPLGNGHVWAVHKNMNEPDNNQQDCTVAGDPSGSVSCDFEND